MDSQLKANWIAALKSGKYEQGTLALKNYAGKYCCMGVLCEISNTGHWDEYNYFIDKNNTRNKSYPPDYLGVGESIIVKLSAMNDSGKSFDDIAEYIQEKV